MKKAQVMQSSLMKLILVALVGGLLMIFIMAIFNTASGAATESACRTSVIVRGNAAIDLGVAGTVDRFTPLVCTTEHKQIEVDNLQGKPDRDLVKRQVSQLASRCWDMFVEGSLPDIFDVDRGEYACHVCFTFRIPGDMSPGEIHPTFFEEDQFNRDPNNLSYEEMLNFFANHDYIRPGYRTGGTTNYISGHHVSLYGQLENIDGPRVRLVNLRAPQGESLFVSDFVGLDEEVINRINQIGDDFITYNRGRLHVIVGDLDANDRNAARNAVTRLGLNSPDRFNAILVFVDTNHLSEDDSLVVRVYAGKEIERYILEPQLVRLVQNHFEGRAITSKSHLQTALIDMLNDLHRNLEVEQTRDFEEESGGVSRNSYLSHLTNDGTNIFLIDDIVANRDYAVAYLSESSNAGALEIGGRLISNVFSADYIQGVVGNVAAGGRFYANIIRAFNEPTDSPTENMIVITRLDNLRDHCEVRSVS